MAVRPILRYPDAGLRTGCNAVAVFDTELRMLAADLLDTMRAAPGVGITAAHIGVFKRVVVMELDVVRGVKTYINPEILWMSTETETHREGSVSMPGATEKVTRPKSIRFRFQDLEGREHEDMAEGFAAICIQHEVDQLNGMFWLMRLSKLKRDRLVRKWEKSGF